MLDDFPWFAAGLSLIWIACCIIEAVGNQWGDAGVGGLVLGVLAVLWVGGRLADWRQRRRKAA